MANTHNLIASSVLSSDSNFTFSSIPQTYTDLVLKYSLRSNGSGGSFATEAISITFNGTTTGYNYQTLLASNSTVSSSLGSATTDIRPTGTTGTSGTANVFSSGELYIPNYADSRNKAGIYNVVATINNSASFQYIDLKAARWTSGAITSISITAFNSSAFTAGSSAYLYGIKNS